MKTPLTIRPCQQIDLDAFYEHCVRSIGEQGTGDTPIFAPYEKWEKTREDFIVAKGKGITAPLGTLDWTRAWLLCENEGTIRGGIQLFYGFPSIYAFHRATVAISIESGYRGEGYGQKLMESAIDWAKQTPSLEWLELYVFEDNTRAIQLYQKLGFQTYGLVPDQLRLFNQPMNDIKMALKLR